MRNKVVAKIILGLIIVVIIGIIVYFVQITQSDIFESSTSTEKALKFLVSFDYTEFNDDIDADESKDKTRIMSIILIMNMKTNSLGVLELPAYTGVHNKENRLVLPIDMAYTEKGFKDYVSHVSSIFKIPNLHYIHIKEDKISNLIDLLGGLKIFLIGKEEYSLGNSSSESLGDAFFDGEDARNYLNNIENDVLNEEITKSSKRKEFIIALIKQIQHKHAEYVTSQKMIGYVYRQVDTSLTKNELNSLFLSLINFDLDKVYFQRISGELRQVDLQQDAKNEKLTILFTSSEVGGLANILKTVEEKLAADKETDIDNKITITILNGTDITGLASKARNLYEKAGFNVISIGNADNSNLDSSILIDRVGDKVRANLVSEVIGIRGIITDITSVDEAGADLTIILGKDFNGEKIQ